jgi:N-acetyl-anhydromuramyl-L-alanine amidase AmpD
MRFKPAIVLAAAALAACASGPQGTVAVLSADVAAATSRGDAIIAAGVKIPIGAPVVTWRDPGGYDAYRERCFFSDRVLPRTPAPGCNTEKRYGARRLEGEVAEIVSRSGWSVETLGKQLDLFVVHYDDAETSRNCFRVLQDLRGLSVHFMLDVDGTLYQTLDLVERARHAGVVNDRSVGIEIAHPGPLELTPGLASRYSRDERGARFDLGKLAADLPPGFVVRPARPQPIEGTIHGHRYTMYDFTEAQYTTLIRLLGTLNKRFPRIVLEAPRDARGNVSEVLALPPPPGAGIVGHYHVSKEKQDPGPAFDWPRVLAGARAVAAEKDQ